MKTLANIADRDEIIARLRAVRATSPHCWGKMNACQMICHLADSFRGVMSERHLSSVQTRMRGPIIKWIALNVPLPWPKGVPTTPEADQLRAGTPPTEFEADRADLLRLLHRFTDEPRDFVFAPHPAFGAMSEKEWMRWGYLHTDHHLRQFRA